MTFEETYACQWLAWSTDQIAVTASIAVGSNGRVGTQVDLDVGEHNVL